MTPQLIKYRVARVLCTCGTLWLTASVASAQAPSWSIRAAAGIANSATNPSPLDSTTTIEVGSSGAFEFDLNHALTPGLDVQFAFLSYGAPITFRQSQSSLSTDGFRFSALTIGVTVDVLRVPQANVYAGPVVAGSTRDSAVAGNGSSGLRVSTPGRLGVGLQAGIRWPGFVDRKRFAVDANVKWLDVRELLNTGARLDSPLIITFGVLYRF